MSDYSKQELIRQWIEIYETYFGYSDCTFDEDLIPDWYNSNKHYGILVMENVSLDETIDACEQQSEVIWNLSDYIGSARPDIIDSREPNSDYCIIFENVHEARRGRETNEDEIQEKGITLLERLLLDIYNYHFYHSHLDQNSTTGCSGSVISSKFDFEDEKIMTVSAIGINSESIKIGSFDINRLNNSRVKIRPYLYYCET
ncbi:MAG: hypothetical protein WCI00_05550 [bacterium]